MQRLWSALGFVLSGLLVLCLALVIASGEAQGQAPTESPPATADPMQLAVAYAAWEQSGHAATFDNGLGADTTCARCKSPLNWDPYNLAAETALDCASCKRVPGQARPVLEGGEAVPEAQWHNIGCEVCHEPVGNSFYVTVSFWNQRLGQYEPVESVQELCAHCHEGSHGFEVVEEMAADSVHRGMTCTECHDPHFSQVRCQDCHNTATGPAAQEHANHPAVSCSACHDQGGLALWWDRDPLSTYYNQVVTRRFAHTLTSWPSHNLQTPVDCRRCHHAADTAHPALAQEVSCDNAACHPQGAVLYWCPVFPRGAVE